MITSERPVAVNTGREFSRAAGGAWAGKQFLKALQAGQPLSASVLRTCDTLRKDEWKSFDEQVVSEGVIRLRGVANLLAAGLVQNIANAFGKTLHEWEDITDMDPAVVSLDGLARGDDDRQEFSIQGVPLPITHKDFNIGIRTLAASRERGEPLNTTQARTAGRLVFEQFENSLYNGLPLSYRGLPVYGLLTHPDRNTLAYSGANWATATGAVMVTDIKAALQVLEADRFYGPYWMDIPTGYGIEMVDDFKTESDKTIMQRLSEIPSLDKITVCDQLPADEVVIYQPTSDVVEWGMGEEVQTVQWDLYGGMQVAFKVLGIQVPIVKSTAALRSGIVHLS